MKSKTLFVLGLVSVSSLLLESAANAASVGVRFNGRDHSGASGAAGIGPSLKPTDLAGVPGAKQTHWNNVAEALTTPEFHGTTAPLMDDSGAPTAVTLTFAANDSWDSNGLTNSPDAILMYGTIKQNKSDTTPTTFKLSNLGVGPYEMYIYFSENDIPPDALMNLTIGGKTPTTFYVKETMNFATTNDPGTYKEAKSTDKANRDTGNYVHLASVTPTNGIIDISMMRDPATDSGQDGVGLNAIQLIGSFPAATPPTAGSTLPSFSKGLVAYWNFDNTNFVDSVGKFDGTGRGTNAIKFVDGKFGQAIKLDGTDQYVEITGRDATYKSDQLAFAGQSLSVAGWFTVDKFDKSWQALIAKGEGTSWRVARRSAESGIAWAGGIGEGNDELYAVTNGQWHHFVAVTDTRAANFGGGLYIDGVLRSTNMGVPNITINSTNNMRIGDNPDTDSAGKSTRSWNGKIDEIGIWNRALRPAEVAALYANQQPPVNYPIFDFGFNEGKGITTTDSVAKIVGTMAYSGPVVVTNSPPGNTTNSPSGKAGDNAVALNTTNATSQVLLVVDDSNNPVLNFKTNAPFTMEAWVNPDVGDKRTYEGIGAYGQSYKMGLGSPSGNATNRGQFVFTLFGVVDLYSGYNPPSGEWHHLAAAWNPGTGAVMFVDGVVVTNIPETRVFKAFQNNFLTIGAENISGTAFQGKIDRFRITKGALTAADLDSDKANPKGAVANTVVAYSFDESAPPFQNLGTNARPARVIEAPIWSTDTPSGLAGDTSLIFTNGQQVIVPDPDALMQLNTNNPSFTIQAWVKFNGNPKQREVFFYSNGPGGAVSASVFTNRTVFVTTLGKKDQSSNAKIPDDGKWHHIAIVHNNKTNFQFYVDGVLADTQAYTDSVIFTRTNQVFYIGSEPTGNLQYLGLLDRLKVNSGALTPDQLDYRPVPQPQLASVGAVDSGVGITFDRPVDPATAGNPTNYTVAGATVLGATVFNGNYVALRLAGVPSAGFTVTVKNVKDLLGNAITGSVVGNGQLSDLISADIGTPGVDPLQPGFGAALGNNGYLIGGGGSDIYGNSDGFHFVYTPFVGSFDVRVRVEWMNPMGTGDPWAKAGLMMRESLTAGSRNVHVHTTRSDSPNNGVYMTWRDTANGATTSSSSYETPVPYPNGWIRLVRPDPSTNVFNAYYSTNGGNWVFAGSHTIPGALLPATVYVGMTVTEHNNTATVPLALATFQQFSLTPYPSYLTAARTYGLGLNFGADAATTAPAKLQPGDVAGVPGVAQANWNNMNGQNGTNVVKIVGDTGDDQATNTSVAVWYTSNGTWASTGEGEENNQFGVGPDRTLMTGYLDTGNATTTSVTISNLPPQLTGSGYDLYLYYMGGVAAGRSGGYRVLDAGTKAVLKDYVFLTSSSNAIGYIEASGSTNKAAPGVGNFFVFSGLKATNITVEATTANSLGGGSPPRAPINALQFVAPSSAAPPLSEPAELGQIINGFQDDFSGPVRDPNWLPVGPGGDHYQQMNGVLYVTTMSGDPNHLIYVGPGGSNTTQEVLARVRVIKFGSGDPSRGGIATCVNSNVTGQLGKWIGLNLNIRNNNENFGGVTNVQHFKMLDDLRAWGPQTTYGWSSNTWYWLRLKTDPSKPDGTNIVYAKTWLADGSAAEPAGWDIKWSNPPTPVHGGFAGITGTSAGGLSEFEVSYILIKSSTLPPIKVNFSVAPLPFAYVRSVSPAMNATSVDPTAPVSVEIVDGAHPIDPKSVTLTLNNTPVAINVSKVADVTTATYMPSAAYTPNSTINVTLGYVENGEAVSGQWSFQVAPYTLDKIHGIIGAIKGPAFFSANGGGHTGKPGDYAINFGETGSGTSVHIADGSFLNTAAAKDILSMSFWIKRLSSNDVNSGSSAFWANSPSSSGAAISGQPSQGRGYQAHTPWTDKNIYFDTAGCCTNTTERISGTITNFAGYKAVGNDGFWTNWHNFVFVKDTSTKYIYIDGTLFLQGTNTLALPKDFTDLWLGSDGSGVQNNLKGLIDDFAVYSTAVSAADAAALASGTLPTALTGETVLAYWDFEDAAASSLRSYSIGLNFGVGDATTATNRLNPGDIAGVPAVAQANWNNISGQAGTNIVNIVDDAVDDTSKTTSVSLTFVSNNTWSSTGHGEENNQFPPGPDRTLMTAYLDTGNATTTSVTISNLPPIMTTNGYSVYVYGMGGVGDGKSGGYRILDAATKAVLKDYVFMGSTSNAVGYVRAPLSINPLKPGIGNYTVFSGLTAKSIIVEATTANGLGFGSGPRAPINAIELVVPPGVGAPPQVLSLSIARAAGGLTITFTGTLQSADEVTGPWTDVAGSSPLTVTPSAAMKFYRAKK